jgi:hypothetical protein
VDFTTPAVLRLAAERGWAQAGMLLAEGLVGVYAVLAVWLIVALRPTPKEVAPPPADPVPSGPEGQEPAPAP